MDYALIVDDEPAICRAVVRILKKCDLGLEGLLTAADGQKGLNLFRQNSADSNQCLLVVSDYIMPRMNGGELARALRQENYQGPIAIFSGTNNDESQNQSLAGLNVTCLNKLNPNVLKPYAQSAVNLYRAQLLAGSSRTVQQPSSAESYILVMDDNPDTLWNTEMVLEELVSDKTVNKIVSAPDGAKGLNHFAQESAGCKLVVTDNNMPMKTGGEVLRALRREYQSDVPVIVATGNSEPIVHQYLTSFQNVKILEKPYLPQELLSLARTMITKY